jgi:hypothetical protein
MLANLDHVRVPPFTVTQCNQRAGPRIMPYRPIAYEHVSDADLKDIFRRADMLLSDCYGMFKLKPSNRSTKTGGGNFSIALVLLCVIDGISCHVYPVTGKQEQRFKRLIREKLHWGPKSKDWYHPIGDAAAILYTELRNPLVHELAIDKPARARLGAGIEEETGIGKWALMPKRFQNINAIDARRTWNDDWPTLSVQPYNGGKRLKLSCAALYWTVKKMVNDLAAEHSTLNDAINRKGARRRS